MSDYDSFGFFSYLHADILIARGVNLQQKNSHEAALHWTGEHKHGNQAPFFFFLTHPPLFFADVMQKNLTNYADSANNQPTLVYSVNLLQVFCRRSGKRKNAEWASRMPKAKPLTSLTDSSERKLDADKKMRDWCF